MDATARSLRLYGLFFPLSRLNFHAPVFFLFLSARFGIDDVLRLSALYYLSVVALEVPSGYLSDRIGRVPTLRLSAVSKIAAYALFLSGGTRFEIHALAEVAMALHWACISGTDTSYHYDALRALGIETEYGDREARLARRGYVSAALSVAIGGGVGFFDLSGAYAFGLAFAGIGLVVTLLMREPARGEDGFARDSFGTQLRECVGALRDPVLVWVSCYVVVMLVLEHIPYEFAQPYTALVLVERANDVYYTPIASAVLYAGVYGVAAFAAGYSMRVRARLGVGGALVAMSALQTTIILAMAIVVHPLVLVLLFARSVQPAISQPIVNATCSPRVRSARRATFFSLQSLAGRLAYGLVVGGLGWLAGEGAEGDPETLGRLLAIASLLGLVATAGLAATMRMARAADPEPS